MRGVYVLLWADSGEGKEPFLICFVCLFFFSQLLLTPNNPYVKAACFGGGIF